MIEADTLRGWAAETEAELATARQELADQIEALHSAQTTFDLAQARQESTQAQLSPLRPPLATRLVARIRGLNDGARSAAGAVVSARNQIALTRETIEDLEEARGQISQLLVALAGPTEAEVEELTHAA